MRFKKQLLRNGLRLVVGFSLWSTGNGWAQPSANGAYRVSRKFIYPKEFPAGRPYTPGVLAGDTLYISGQIDKHPQTGAQPKGIAEQTRMAMTNMRYVLRDAGMDFGNVVSCHVQLANIGQYKDMNEVYGSFFGPDHYPARTTLEFPGLPGGANIEISCIAYADKSKISLVTPPKGSVPAATGPYRPAVFAGDTLYVSGSGGGKPPNNEVDATIEGQTKQTMENIGKILAAAGLQHKDAVFTNVYFVDPAGLKGGVYGKLNSVYKDSFALGSAPSRASFCVSKLPGSHSVAITFIATRDRKNKGRVVPASAGLSPTSSNGGVLDKDTLYTSGKSGSGATLEAQMRDSIESIRDILKLAGMNLENVVDAHVYLKDLGQMDAMNAIFKEYFPKNPPARTTVQVFQDQLEQVQVVAVR
ncbi:MAG TPA: RidA family protein [Bryobacteraceae bacterium]|nr:RidA family protein [Bryobacteraceae bacterium]